MKRIIVMLCFGNIISCILCTITKHKKRLRYMHFFVNLTSGLAAN